MSKHETDARNSLRRERYAHRKAVKAGLQWNKPWNVEHSSHHPSDRIVDVDGAANIRTMKGMPTVDGGVLEGDRVLRGEAPYLLTSAGVKSLVESGVTHFVDLRGDKERASEGNGALQPYIDSGEVKVYYIPMGLSQEFLDAHPGFNPYDDLGDTYLRVLEGSKAQVAETLREAAVNMEADGGRVYVHCAAGKDRTSMIMATLLDVAGADREAVVDDYVATASVFGPVVEKLKARPEYKKDFVDSPPEKFTPNRTVMERFMGLLEEQGGISGTLRDGGMTDDDLMVWRGILRHG